MLVTLLLLLGQKPLVLESPQQSVDGDRPRIRLVVPGQQSPPTLEFEGRVESPEPPHALEFSLEGVGFEWTTLPGGQNLVRIRAIQTQPGNLPPPTPSLLWKKKGETVWRKFTWRDPLSFPKASPYPGPEKSSPEISKDFWHWICPPAPGFWMLTGLALLASLLAVLAFRAKPSLSTLLNRPDPVNSMWWEKVHTEFRHWLGTRVHAHPGSTPEDFEQLWKGEALPHPDQMLDLARRLDAIRFQPAPIDADQAEAWIRDAKDWLPHLSDR